MTRTEALRNLMGIINRSKNPTGQTVEIINNLVSPPYKGENPNKIPYTYPESLSGLHAANEQKIRISGDTSGQNSLAS